MGTTAIERLEPLETIFHDAVVAAGDGTVADYGSKYTALLLEVTIAGTATITPKAKILGDYVNIPATNRNTGVTALTITASGLYELNITGAKSFIADITSWSSGAVTARGRAVAVPLPQAQVTLVGNSAVAGDVAHDAADSGNPVKIGGKAETTIPAAVADADRVNAWFDSYGRLVVAMTDTSGGIASVAASSTDNNSVSALSLNVNSKLYAFNTTGFDRLDSVNTGQLKITPYSSTGVEGAAGDVAHGAADAGNPVKTGGKATAAAPAAVDEGDRVDASFTLTGSQRMEVTGSSVAHDAPSTANPVLTGFVAEATVPAAVADGDLSQDAGTLYGARFVNPVTSVGAQITAATGAATPAGAMQAGGTYNSTPPTLTTGLMGALQLDARGNALVSLRSGANEPYLTTSVGALGDSWAMAVAGFVNASLMYADNGTSRDRWRNNTEGTLLASAARTTNTSSANQTNYNARGVALTLDVTANPGGAETLTVSIGYVDALGKLKYVATFPAIAAAANATYVYVLYPGAVETIATSALEVQGLPLTRTWVALVQHSSTGSWTYSLTGQPIL